MTGRLIETSSLVEAGIAAVKTVREGINSTLRGNAELRFKKAAIERADGSTRKALQIDLKAEEMCRVLLNDEFKDDVFVMGEESLGTKWRNKICALVDMIDGTDLLEMNVPLWCSAIVFFSPAEQKILASIVGLSTGEIYYAADYFDGARVQRSAFDGERTHHSDNVWGPSQTRQLASASVGFYGQKASRMVALSENRRFIEKLRSISEADKATFRMYNFAGNPIMVKMVDRLRNENEVVVDRSIDAIFDVAGQQPHDVIPGAYIALRAGAHMRDMENNAITEDDLARKLLEPRMTLSYVLASTPELATELVECLR